jgi:pSer/pThr/pTyr-binding forkhead associated (FHA) protein
MYHSRKLPVLIQRPVRLSNGSNGKVADDAKHGRLYISVPDEPARLTCLDKPLLTIGRSRRNDIVLSESDIAPFHARLKQTAEGWEVEDLGSESGTRLNGSTLEPNAPMNWASRQPLKIADYTLQWLQPANGAAAPVFGAGAAAAAVPPLSKGAVIPAALSRPRP